MGAGGGGLAHGPFTDDGSQHGHGHNKSVRNQTGDAFGTYPAGTFFWQNINLIYFVNWQKTYLHDIS